MRRYILLLMAPVIFLSSCISVNKDPNILLNDPYNKVDYIANPGDRYQTLDVIQVTTRGSQANILNTIPKLYLKALEKSENRPVALSNIRITPFIKREEYDVPYRECLSIPRLVSVPRTSCATGPCSTIYEQQTTYQRQCTTEYRTEVRDVLYQEAVADILTIKTGR